MQSICFSCRSIALSHAALQVVLKKSQNKDQVAKRVEDAIVEFANRGYRALGVAHSEGSDKVCFPSAGAVDHVVLTMPHACGCMVPCHEAWCRVLDPKP